MNGKIFKFEYHKHILFHVHKGMHKKNNVEEVKG